MIVVDTSVLSLAFRRKAGAESEAAKLLERLILRRAPLWVPGIVLQELLSGIRAPEQARRLLRLMEGFPLLLADRDSHVEAAAILNACRSAGVAATAMDCLIAAQALQRKATLLTADADFERIARQCGLALFPPGRA